MWRGNEEVIKQTKDLFLSLPISFSLLRLLCGSDPISCQSVEFLLKLLVELLRLAELLPQKRVGVSQIYGPAGKSESMMIHIVWTSVSPHLQLSDLCCSSSSLMRALSRELLCSSRTPCHSINQKGVSGISGEGQNHKRPNWPPCGASSSVHLATAGPNAGTDLCTPEPAHTSTTLFTEHRGPAANRFRTSQISQPPLLHSTSCGPTLFCSRCISSACLASLSLPSLSCFFHLLCSSSSSSDRPSDGCMVWRSCKCKKIFKIF